MQEKPDVMCQVLQKKSRPTGKAEFNPESWAFTKKAAVKKNVFFVDFSFWNKKNDKNQRVFHQNKTIVGKSTENRHRLFFTKKWGEAPIGSGALPED